MAATVEPSVPVSAPPPVPSIRPAPSAPPELAAFLPRYCNYRVYWNIDGSKAGEEDTAKLFFDYLVKNGDPRGRLSAMVQALSDGGLDPRTALSELAICGDPDVAAIRIPPLGNRALQTLERAGDALQKGNPAITTVGGRSVFRFNGREAAFVVEDGVLILTGDLEDAFVSVDERAGQDGFVGAADTVLWASLGDDAFGSIRRGADTASFEGVVMGRARSMRRTEEEVREYIDNGRAFFRSNKSFAHLAGVLDRVQIRPHPQGMVVRGSFTMTELRDTLRRATQLDVRELEDLVEGRLFTRGSSSP
ncbi:MAG: hypothetical protein AAGA56_05210 [Myxococcota bacterium]